MSVPSPPRSDKHRGEWAEAQFVADALKNGFEIFTPIGDCSSIDFVIFHDGKPIRIQCKATWTNLKGKSKWNIGKGSSAKKRYTDHDVDFLALYDGNIECWRFVRPSETNGQKTFRIAQDETNKLENWHDLKEFNDH
jgi:hypothetical protein